MANLESKLADEVELAKLNSEQINDLLTELERKVERLLRQQEKAHIIQLEKKPTQKESLLAMFKKCCVAKGKIRGLYGRR